MKVALIDGSKKIKVIPWALLKIGNYLKSEGHEVELLKTAPQKFYDEVWISSIFTFHIDYVNKLIAQSRMWTNKIVVGGVAPTLMPDAFFGADVIHNGLFLPAEKYPPDYTLLNEAPKVSVTRTSYGCIRKCKFCAVTKLEPEFKERENWVNDIHPQSRKLLLYDNNWTAKSLDEQTRDIEILEGQKQLREIDFNQALDCRLFNADIARLLTRIPLKPLRFSFDGKWEDGYFQDAIRTAVKHGHKNIVSYVLYNFTDTVEDLYYRLREIAKLQNELWATNPGLTLSSYPMCYRPLHNTNSRNTFVGKHWTQKEKYHFNRTLYYTGFMGHFIWGKKRMGSSMKKFEFVMGKTAAEFKQFLQSENAIGIIMKKKAELSKKE